MPYALSLLAAVLPPLLAALAATASVGQQADHLVPGLKAGYLRSHLNHFTGYFMTQDYSRPDSPPQHTGHDQQIMVAETAGFNLNQDLTSSRGWGRYLADGKGGRGAWGLQY